ncbi:sperm equatorial segment protein 1 isoform X1 [Marmota marmota marmota]|uniref:sperm equatorial segment protein 1 isoform X1 n=1 Tax=Marmota marmota marmota TaxID=9994 RepID=UPI000762A580|nr:sperm equatorial segment protein 1 isoform X1 [Marmota marmota marmota]
MCRSARVRVATGRTRDRKRAGGAVGQAEPLECGLLRGETRPVPPWASSRRLGITVSRDEEQNLNHYVQVLENLILSVPTREPGPEEKSKSPKNLYSIGSKRSKSEETVTLSTENNVLIKDVSAGSTPFSTRDFTSPGVGKKLMTENTPFWSIRPNNVSVVLRAEEPYIEKEEPEPEPEPEPETVTVTKRSRASTLSPSITQLSTATSSTAKLSPFTTLSSTSRSQMYLWTDSEDVPQLSDDSASSRFKFPVYEQHSDNMRNDIILRKISEIYAQMQQAPPGDSNNPEYKEYIKASKELLKRSLALAEAAEYRLEKMYTSEALAQGRTSNQIVDIETVINTLYNSRSKLPEYLDIKYVPAEMRERANTVFSTLKNILCAGQVETQNLIKKLLSNNIKMLNLLDIPR